MKIWSISAGSGAFANSLTNPHGEIHTDLSNPALIEKLQQLHSASARSPAEYASEDFGDEIRIVVRRNGRSRLLVNLQFDGYAKS